MNKKQSMLENNVLKEKHQLPTKWENLKYIDGYWVSTASKINPTSTNIFNDNHKNIIRTRKQAEALIALSMLSHLMYIYNDGWEPDWEDNTIKAIIYFKKNKIFTTGLAQGTSSFLAFKTVERRNLFYENFKDLIEQAKPLM